MSAALVRQAFGDVSLYAILGVEKTATAEQIKRAYFKKALQYVRAPRGRRLPAAACPFPPRTDPDHRPH